MIELPSERSVEINGKPFKIAYIPSSNKNAIAKMRDGKLVISIPRKWSKKDRFEIGKKLEKRAVRSIEKGRWNPEDNAPLRFMHGQRINPMGKEFLILFGKGDKSKGRLNDRIIEVELPNPDDHETASLIVGKILAKSMLPLIRKRVDELNQKHFGATINRVSLREATTRWGSLSRRNSMSLNIRLLFMPESIRDYVIVHELAHTRYRNHGRGFWSLVEKIVPDYRERRKWLRLNGWRCPEKTGAKSLQTRPSSYSSMDPLSTIEP